MKKIFALLALLALFGVGFVGYQSYQQKQANLIGVEMVNSVLPANKSELLYDISALKDLAAGVPQHAEAIKQLQQKALALDGSSDRYAELNDALQRQRTQLASQFQGIKKTRLIDYFVDLRSEAATYQNDLKRLQKAQREAQKSGLQSLYEHFYGIE